MELIEVTELLGDGISPELNQAVKRVAEVIPLEFKFHSIDWSLPNREQLGEAAIDLAEESLRRTKLALKYPTTTKLASPNAAIRRRCGFSVIYRPAISIRGIDSKVGGTYD
ncbi:MAG TPA: isocitrate dehydrogenase, partial [Gammaproteobacteria bacterium]|nr:isocitrate dehydrogenase [Gammaproteobacteria bacterium]